ncbi:MAG: AAA family ATPase [Candidatus Magasanikbacteria bacterium]|nr:AAA family ATPase [Candidatus Magasanikbacteria bacterium]
MTQSEALGILKTGANVFLTGEPGSGKTHTVNEYAEFLRARGIEPAITASTGIAATHLNGMTIHSWSGLGIKSRLTRYDLDKIASTEYIVKRVKSARVLIIDEVSMLSAETLAMIDVICREIKDDKQSFGGLQTILVGDFFQLPPVIKNDLLNRRQTTLIEDLSGRFAYDSPAWNRANFTVCYLTEQYRQDDKDFLAILSAIRRNAFSNEHLRHLATRKIEINAAPANAPKLFSHNVDVDYVNSEILAKLPNRTRIFDMSAEGPAGLVTIMKKGCLSPESLCLKTNAAVMFTKNNLKEGFVNGTLGIVLGFDKMDNSPVVKTLSGKRIKVEPMDWTVEENGYVRARLTQRPLRLAWAITVHKSQGISLDEAVMDLSQVFEFGQGYVALSRVRRLAGVHLLGWNDRAFQVHPEVLTKDEKFRADSDSARIAFAKLAGLELEKMHRDFLVACNGRFDSVDSGVFGEKKKKKKKKFNLF